MAMTGAPTTSVLRETRLGIDDKGLFTIEGVVRV